MTGSAPATANDLLARPATISSSGINRPLCFQRKPNGCRSQRQFQHEIATASNRKVRVLIILIACTIAARSMRWTSSYAFLRGQSSRSRPPSAMLGLRHQGPGIRSINSGVAMSGIENACCSPKTVSRARCQLESTFCSTIRRFLPIQMTSICASLNSYVQDDDCFFLINVRISHVSISQKIRSTREISCGRN
jgi:hypothetical protein